MIEVRWLGRAVPYRRALAEQERLLEAVRTGAAPPTVLLLEHAPVITIGRGLQRRPAALEPPAPAPVSWPEGVEVIAAARGGGATYHGPGQLVGYPIVPLRGRDLHAYLRALEGALITASGRFGVRAHRRAHFTGVWVGAPGRERKLASIGIGCRRWVTWHGFALQVGADLGPLVDIAPCGLRGDVMTSLSEACGRSLELDAVRPVVADEVCAALEPLID